MKLEYGGSIFGKQRERNKGSERKIKGGDFLKQRLLLRDKAMREEMVNCSGKSTVDMMMGLPLDTHMEL
jgi:hypothetical protein